MTNIEQNPHNKTQTCSKFYRSKNVTKQHSEKYQSYSQLPFPKILIKRLSSQNKRNRQKMNSTSMSSYKNGRHIRNKTEDKFDLNKISQSKEQNEENIIKKYIVQRNFLENQQNLSKHYKILKSSDPKNLNLFLIAKRRQKKEYLIKMRQKEEKHKNQQLQQNQEQNKVQDKKDEENTDLNSTNVPEKQKQKEQTSQNVRQKLRQSSKIRIKTSIDKSKKSPRIRTQYQYEKPVNGSPIDLRSFDLQESVMGHRKRESITNKDFEDISGINKRSINKVFVPILLRKGLTPKLKQRKEHNNVSSTKSNKVQRLESTYQSIKDRQKEQKLQKQIQRVQNYFKKRKISKQQKKEQNKHSKSLKEQQGRLQKSPKLKSEQQQKFLFTKTESLSSQRIDLIGKIVKQNIKCKTQQRKNTQTLTRVQLKNISTLLQEHNKQQTKQFTSRNQNQNEQCSSQTIVIHDNTYRKQVVIVSQSELSWTQQSRKPTNSNVGEDVHLENAQQNEQNGENTRQMLGNSNNRQEQRNVNSDQTSCIIY